MNHDAKASTLLLVAYTFRQAKLDDITPPHASSPSTRLSRASLLGLLDLLLMRAFLLAMPLVVWPVGRTSAELFE